MTTKPKEKPILFDAESIRAILDGRKTQTRRVINLPEACSHFDDLGDGLWRFTRTDGCNGNQSFDVDSGYRPGDILWVKEAWRVAACYNDITGGDLGEILGLRNVQYEADPKLYRWLGRAEGRYRHARFMPRWASRIDLLVKSVRAERLQDISEDDARDEGVEPIIEHTSAWVPQKTPLWRSYMRRWQALNDHRPGCRWADNPYVRVIEFERVRP